MKTFINENDDSDNMVKRKCPLCKKEMVHEFSEDTFHCDDQECPFPYDIERKNYSDEYRGM